MNKNTETIAIITFYTIVALYVIACAFDTIELLSTIGLSMIPVKPSFSVYNLITKGRKYRDNDSPRKFAALHCPTYKVLDFSERYILDHRIHRDFMMNTSRGQSKWITHGQGILHIAISNGYSSVRIGARQVFAIDEWTRTIYHIDRMGKLHVTDFYMDYDMTDVIAQVTECLEVCKEHYNAEKWARVDAKAKEHDWQVISDTCEFTERVEWDRTTVKVWLKEFSKTSVEWERQYGRINLNGSVSYKTEKGKYPKAYQIVIGDTVAWIPHSILSHRTVLHGGRVQVHPGDDKFLTFQMSPQSIDLPNWWLSKTLGKDYIGAIEPIAKSEFFAKHVPKRRWRR
jgi:hypothetical protein